MIYLASTYGEVFWIFPLIVTMGSLAGNALTVLDRALCG